MRVEVTPRQADITPGLPLLLSVTVWNTSTVIGGYALRVLGADPGWIDFADLGTPADAAGAGGEFSLFPDESRTLTVVVNPPEGLPAGPRRLAIQVRELTEPYGSTITELDLTVPEARVVRLRPDPLMVTAGKRGNFGVIVENNGNTQVHAALDGSDPEGQVHFDFEPPVVSLLPGERALVDMTARAKRRLLGQPVIRQLGLYLDEVAPEGFFEPEPTQPEGPKLRDEATALAQATFVQKPVISRGGISLFGLLAAVTVFALVITFALSRLVGQSAADRDLALQIAAAQNSSGAGGTSSVGGTVRLLTTGEPAQAVSVSVFNTTDMAVAVATTATAKDGTYKVANLPAGTYKLSFRGAGFVQLWYPGAASDSDATAVELDSNTARTGLDVVVGGVPASIGGKVVGDDVSAATLYLEKPAASTGTSVAASSVATTTGNSAGTNPPPDNGSAVVQSVPIASDGSFDLSNVPSPSIYDLVVVKPGYATATQRIDIGAGEKRSGLVITLAKGDGSIAGSVNSSDGPLEGVTITATTGQSTATTVSLSKGSTGGVGTFTLRGLATPASFTVVASKAGFASQTQTVTLAAGQELTGMAITLTKSSGSLSGDVTLLPSNKPAPGVAVTVTNGQLSVQTFSQSTGNVGHWTVGGLPLPGTYTVTLSRADLAAQTVSVSLDASGNVTPGSQGATVDAQGEIGVGMQSATAVVAGTVKQRVSATSTASVPVGEVSVMLTSGTSSYQVTTASVPSGSVGSFRIESLPPGTWTVSVQIAGTTPTSTILTLHAGDVKEFNPVLAAPASIAGRVTDSDGNAQGNWIVQAYKADEYPNVVAYSTKTDTQGRYSFPAVNAGSYVIVTRPNAGSAEAASIAISVDPSEQVTSPKGDITGADQS